MRVLVTGAAGFIGKEIVLVLESAGHEVVKLGRKAVAANSETEDSNGEFYALDLANKASVTSLPAISNVDAVIHAAGLGHQFGKVSGEDFFSVNADGTQNTCDIALKLGAKRLILISSVSVYGNFANRSGDVGEDFECKPEGDYAESKLRAELIAGKLCGENGISLTILRPATVVGEGDIGNVAKLISAIDRRRFIWIGKGENSKSLIDKNDVARACSEILEKSKADFEVFNLSAKALKMRELVEAISFALGKKAPGLYLPADLVKFFLDSALKIFRFREISNFRETLVKWLPDDVYSPEKIKTPYRF